MQEGEEEEIDVVGRGGSCQEEEEVDVVGSASEEPTTSIAKNDPIVGCSSYAPISSFAESDPIAVCESMIYKAGRLLFSTDEEILRYIGFRSSD